MPIFVWYAGLPCCRFSKRYNFSLLERSKAMLRRIAQGPPGHSNTMLLHAAACTMLKGRFRGECRPHQDSPETLPWGHPSTTGDQ